MEVPVVVAVETQELQPGMVVVEIRQIQLQIKVMMVVLRALTFPITGAAVAEVESALLAQTVRIILPVMEVQELQMVLQVQM
jgi:hypothetical protein